MSKLLHVIALVLALSGAALAGPVEDAEAAWSRGDYAAALRLWRPLADQGDAAAQFALGVMYEGGHGVPRDDTEAARWYRRAADQGFDVAQHNLGLMYHLGRGVPQNDAEAARWYRRAADQGLAESQANLGTMYGSGRGVPQDYIQAHMWFSLAAARSAPGDTRDTALRNRDRAAALLTPAQIAEAERLAREWEAAHPAR